MSSTLISTKKSIIKFDVMQGDRFVCTLRMPHNPLFKLDIEELLDYTLQKRPTLKYATEPISFHIDLSDN